MTVGGKGVGCRGVSVGGDGTLLFELFSRRGGALSPCSRPTSVLHFWDITFLWHFFGEKKHEVQCLGAMSVQWMLFFWYMRRLAQAGKLQQFVLNFGLLAPSIVWGWALYLHRPTTIFATLHLQLFFWEPLNYLVTGAAAVSSPMALPPAVLSCGRLLFGGWLWMFLMGVRKPKFAPLPLDGPGHWQHCLF